MFVKLDNEPDFLEKLKIMSEMTFAEKDPYALITDRES